MYFAFFVFIFSFLDYSSLYIYLQEVYICSVFNHLLDDMPLPANEVSSSVLVASYSNSSMPNVKGTTGGGKPGINGEIEKGLLTLFSSDSPGLQVLFLYLCQ